MQVGEYDTFQKNLVAVSKKVSDISLLLGSMEGRLKTLQQTTSKVHGDITNYNRISKNVNTALKRLETIREVYLQFSALEDQVKRCEQTDSEPMEQLDGVMETLRQICELKIHLENDNLSYLSSAIDRINELLKSGIQTLQSLCITQLSSFNHMNQDPIDVLDWKYQWAFPTVELKAFVSLIHSFDKDVLIPCSCSSEIDTLYISSRSEYLSGILQEVGKNVDVALLRNQASQNMSDEISIYSAALVRLLPLEANELIEIYGLADAKQLYPLIVNRVVDMVNTVFQQVFQIYNDRYVYDNYILFPMVGNLSTVITVLAKDMPFEDEALTMCLVRIKKKIEKLISSNIVTFYESICTNNTSLKLSLDRIDEETAGVTEYLSILCSSEHAFYLFQRIGNWGWRNEQNIPLDSPNHMADAAGIEIVTNYVMDCIENYIESVRVYAKATTQPPSFASAQVLLVFYHIDHALRALTLNETLYENLITRLSDCKQRFTSAYMDIWNKCSQNLLDATYTKSSSNKTGMAAKDRETLKERFRNFNEQITQVVEIHKAQVRFDPETAPTLLREVLKTVVPLYERFYDRYANSDFTKKREKYIKFGKTDLNTFITSAFEAS